MIKILKPGLFTTIQDLGRFGYRDSGVPVSGCMDMASSKKANKILGNAANDAVLEITMLGPKIEFTKGTQIAITGAELSPIVDSRSLQNNCVVDIKAGDVLCFGKLNKGLRAYLAVKGGFQSQKVLGSRSLFVPVTKASCLKKGDTVAFDAFTDSKVVQPDDSYFETSNFQQNTLTVFEGPEFNQLHAKQKAMLFETNFHISKYYDRMAYRLYETLSHNLPSILTGPVLPGTVQLTPSGEFIILMRDAQTTGGYPRILQLSESSINVLSQKKERDTIHFKRIGK